MEKQTKERTQNERAIKWLRMRMDGGVVLFYFRDTQSKRYTWQAHQTDTDTFCGQRQGAPERERERDEQHQGQLRKVNAAERRNGEN